MIYAVTAVAIVGLVVIGFMFERLIKVLDRQSEYIMAKENERSYQLSKPARVERAIDKKAQEQRRKQDELYRLYDIALSRGEIDEDSYKALKQAEVA